MGAGANVGAGANMGVLTVKGVFDGKSMVVSTKIDETGIAAVAD